MTINTPSIPAILKSRKFWMSVIASAIASIALYAPLSDKNLDREHKQQAITDYVYAIAGIWGISIAATAYVDGKSSAQNSASGADTTLPAILQRAEPLMASEASTLLNKLVTEAPALLSLISQHKENAATNQIPVTRPLHQPIALIHPDLAEKMNTLVQTAAAAGAFDPAAQKAALAVLQEAAGKAQTPSGSPSGPPQTAQPVPPAYIAGKIDATSSSQAVPGAPKA